MGKRPGGLGESYDHIWDRHKDGAGARAFMPAFDPTNDPLWQTLNAGLERAVQLLEDQTVPESIGYSLVVRIGHGLVRHEVSLSRPEGDVTISREQRFPAVESSSL